MAFMYRGITNVSVMLRSNRNHFKYLLAVPFLVALAVASYKIGHSTNALTKNELKDEVLRRQKRDVTKIPEQYMYVHANSLKQAAAGVIYTRWGRTKCPEGVDAVYSGVTGGSSYGNHGGGANPLCLPIDPLWGTYNEATEKASKLYGAEYENPSGFDLKHVGGRSLHDHNVPCVVCHSKTKSSILMIPARNRCYGNWSVEYTGNLMSGNSGHQGRSQFICMDGSPESDPAGFRDEPGSLFYNVEGVCGSLPCPPYVPRREITCVVCSN